MKRHLLGFLLFIVFCAFGVYFSPLWFRSIGLGHGCLIEDHDVGTYSISYESSQFNKVYYFSACFKCAEKSDKAVDFFHKWIEPAIEVIERTPKFDSQGIEVGERIVARFYSRELNEYYYEVAWIEDGILYEIASKSLRHVLEFEKYPDRRY